MFDRALNTRLFETVHKKGPLSFISFFKNVECALMASRIYVERWLMTKSCDSSVFHVNSFECLNVFLSKFSELDLITVKRLS